MSAPGKDLVFALLVLEVKCQGVRRKSYLVVNLPTSCMPDCCPRQLVRVGSFGKDVSVDLCEL